MIFVGVLFVCLFVCLFVVAVAVFFFFFFFFFLSTQTVEKNGNFIGTTQNKCNVKQNDSLTMINENRMLFFSMLCVWIL